MHQNVTKKMESALLGAVVADSASMGLHWIYDTARLAEVGGDAPEFHVPDATNYEGVVGVFAHGGRPVGSLSRYGATVELVANQMKTDGGVFNAPANAARFLSAFGYGGSFVGYVDHPAAGALDVIRKRDSEIEASFRGLTDRIPFHTIVAIGPFVQHIASDSEVGDAESRLRSALEGFPDVSLDDEQMALVIARIDSLHERYWSPTGVPDLQLPVLAPVIPAALAAAARGLDDTAYLSAVRTAAHLTHTEDNALAVGDFVASMIKLLLAGSALEPAIESSLPMLPAELEARVTDALNRSWGSTVAAAEELGMSCALAEGLPLSLVTLTRAESYIDAVRTTILCGGDSCGRGLLVGAIAGLMWGTDGSTGVPQEWVGKVAAADSVRAAAAGLA